MSQNTTDVQIEILTEFKYLLFFVFGRVATAAELSGEYTRRTDFWEAQGVVVRGYETILKTLKGENKPC